MPQECIFKDCHNDGLIIEGIIDDFTLCVFNFAFERLYGVYNGMYIKILHTLSFKYFAFINA